MLDIKTKVYTLLSSLSIDIQDTTVDANRLQKDKMPYGLFRTITAIPTEYKNYTKVAWSFNLDIFSNYSGEKEVLDLYSQVKEAVSALQKEDGITYVSTYCKIVDDKETGPVLKHGIITIEVNTMEVPA